MDGPSATKVASAYASHRQQAMRKQVPSALNHNCMTMVHCHRHPCGGRLHSRLRCGVLIVCSYPVCKVRALQPVRFCTQPSTRSSITRFQTAQRKCLILRRSTHCRRESSSTSVYQICSTGQRNDRGLLYHCVRGPAPFTNHLARLFIVSQ
jgi:hypothetical protein